MSKNYSNLEVSVSQYLNDDSYVFYFISWNKRKMLQII